MSERVNDSILQSLARDVFGLCSSASLSEQRLREIIGAYNLNRVKPYNSIGLDLGAYPLLSLVCYNKQMSEGIVRLMIEHFPATATISLPDGSTPLHNACRNNSVTVEIIQLLIDAAPDSVQSDDDSGSPLHSLCDNDGVDEDVALNILKLLLEKCPESIRRANRNGVIPIHVASMKRSPEFCRILLDAYPGSERIGCNSGVLPFHWACGGNSLHTVQYLYKLYPSAIEHSTSNRDLPNFPIYFAIKGLKFRRREMDSVEIVRFLLSCNSCVKEQKNYDGSSLLYTACKDAIRSGDNTSDSKIEAAILMIKEIYDDHPYAVETNSFKLAVSSFHPRVQAFINEELIYARWAEDRVIMTIPEYWSEQLKLHRALQNNVRLGSIKILLKGNPSAISCTDKDFALPVHLACQSHKSARVVQYVIDECPRTIRQVDFENNTVLHYACRGAKYGTIALLLEKYNVGLVSMTNVHNQLPIELLFERLRFIMGHGEIVEYTSTIFSLIRAYPQTISLLSDGCKLEQNTRSGSFQSGNEKKRKLKSM